MKRKRHTPEQIKVDALAWGYETEPGVAVAAGAPAPGAAGAFVIAGAAALRRRRRDGSESRPTRSPKPACP